MIPLHRPFVFRVCTRVDSSGSFTCGSILRAPSRELASPEFFRNPRAAVSLSTQENAMSSKGVGTNDTNAIVRIKMKFEATVILVSDVDREGIQQEARLEAGYRLPLR